MGKGLTDHLVMAFTTGLYTGFLPKAPGTWGSLLAIPAHLFFQGRPLWMEAGSLALLSVISVPLCSRAALLLGSSDPPQVVIDEIAGMWLALLAIPAQPLSLLMAFCLFRLFDIIKPPPIGALDRKIPGGLGIMADDLAAGALANIVMLFYLFSLKP